MVNCSYCGTEIKEEDYCPECGKKQRENIQKNERLKLWEAIAIIILLPLGLYWILGIIFGIIGVIISIWYVNKKGIIK